MFAVNGKDRNALLSGQLHDDVTGSDQGFLVGQGDLLAGFDCGDGGTHTDHSHDRGDKIVIAFHGGHFQYPIHTAEDLDVQILYADPQIFSGILVPHHCRFRPEFANLRFYQIYALPRAKCRNFDVFLFSCHVQSLSSDGSGRAQYRYFFHCLYLSFRINV